MIRVGHDKDMKEGDKRMVRAGNKEILVVRLEDGFYAIDGWCSHMRAPLDRGQVVDHSVRCRVHGAVFDLRTGKVLMNPQARDLRTYPVTVEGGEVFVQYQE